jgi:hypothetical protein
MRSKIEEVIEKQMEIDELCFDNEIVSCVFKSSNNPEIKYATALNVETLEYICSCMGFLTHKKPCKHIKALAWKCYRRGLIGLEKIRRLEV